MSLLELAFESWEIVSSPDLLRSALFLEAEWRFVLFVLVWGVSKAGNMLMLSTTGYVFEAMPLKDKERDTSSGSSLFIQNYWSFWACLTSLRWSEGLCILLTVNTPHFLTIKGVEVNAGQTASFHCTVNGRKKDNFHLWLQVRLISF